MTEQFLIGTYTKKDSKGVYKVTLDPQKEEITKVELAIPSQKSERGKHTERQILSSRCCMKSSLCRKEKY